MSQATFSFMELVKATANLPKTSRSKADDPLSIAKRKLIAALRKQGDYVEYLLLEKPLP